MEVRLEIRSAAGLLRWRAKAASSEQRGYCPKGQNDTVWHLPLTYVGHSPTHFGELKRDSL